MDLQTQIQTIFAGKAFQRPLFYSYGGGLRFELSESGTYIQQFLLAIQKATEVCRDIFDRDTITVCLRFWSDSNRFARRKMLAELHDAEIYIPRQRCIWLEEITDDYYWNDGEDQFWVNIAFELPVSLLQNLLWCAASSDILVRPRPRGCLVYLFNLNKQLMVFPYDDRGMDVVGPNHEALSCLYTKHQQYLLEYDREQMDLTFQNHI